jgi:hypothetical protein
MQQELPHLQRFKFVAALIVNTQLGFYFLVFILRYLKMLKFWIICRVLFLLRIWITTEQIEKGLKAGANAVFTTKGIYDMSLKVIFIYLGRNDCYSCS